MVEEFEVAMEFEVEGEAMVWALVESDEEPLTHNPEAIGELLYISSHTCSRQLLSFDIISFHRLLAGSCRACDPSLPPFFLCFSLSTLAQLTKD